MTHQTRRSFLQHLATTTGGIVMAPWAISCGGATSEEGPLAPTTPATPTGLSDPLAIPLTQPAAWDPIGFNRKRGNAGAIPDAYRPLINGPDGDNKHIGKHLPYLPKIDPATVPPGYIALMWGAASLGYARHPNSPAREGNGHWYNWVKLRKATGDDSEKLRTSTATGPP